MKSPDDKCRDADRKRQYATQQAWIVVIMPGHKKYLINSFLFDNKKNSSSCRNAY